MCHTINFLTRIQNYLGTASDILVDSTSLKSSSTPISLIDNALSDHDIQVLINNNIVNEGSLISWIT
jgi:hypothetical protein